MMFATHLSNSVAANSSKTIGPSLSIGICLSTSLNHASKPGKFWIVDSGASKHICSDATLFLTMNPIQNSTITLTDNNVIPVNALGDVHLSSHFLLKDTLYVPQFPFNLIPVSALTADSRLMVQFYHDQFIIQETSTKRMIGKGDRISDLYLFYPVSSTSLLLLL